MPGSPKKDLFCCCRGDFVPRVQCRIKPRTCGEHMVGCAWLKSIGRFARAAQLCCRSAVLDQGLGFGCSSRVCQPWDELSVSLV